MFRVKKGVTIYDILREIESLLTDMGWTVKKKDTDGSNITYIIFEGIGDGGDKIYLQFKADTETNTSIIIDSSVGYDTHLEHWEQPGSIQQWNKLEEDTPAEKNNCPTLTVTYNEEFNYWLFADTYRLVIVVRMSTFYVSAYMGFINPVSSERQYTYPVYIAGNATVKNQDMLKTQGSFVFPKDGSGYIRRVDGEWRKFDCTLPNPDPDTDGTIFPYNTGSKKLITNYKDKDSQIQDNFLLFPIILQIKNPTDVCGILRGVYWISGARDIEAEKILNYNNSNYMCFDTKEERGTNTYFCVDMG